MATAPHYGDQIPLLGAGDQDWINRLNQAISGIANLLLHNQLPSALKQLKWGDITGGNYIQVDSTGTHIVGTIFSSNQPIQNLVVDRGASFPAGPTAGQVFYRTDTTTFYVWNGAAWDAIGTVSGAAVAAAGAIMRTDIGATLGNLVTVDGAGDPIELSGANDNDLLQKDSAEATGWKFVAPLVALAVGAAKGSLIVGTGANTLAFQAAGADGRILQYDSGEAGGLAVRTMLAALAIELTNKGELAAGNGGGACVAVAAPAAGQLLAGNPGVAGGMEWVDPSAIGATVNQLTLVSGKMYAFRNFR